MGRIRSISNEQILEAARALFLERGLAVTTAEIAARAGISEGTIFNRYPSKLDLFKAAVGIASPRWHRSIPELQGKGDPRKNLERLTNEIIAFFQDLIPRLNLALSSSCKRELLQQDGADSPPLKSVRLLSDYFTAEQGAKRVSTHASPQILARILIGSIHSFVFFEHLGFNQYLPVEQDLFVEELVSVVLGNGREQAGRCGPHATAASTDGRRR